MVITAAQMMLRVKHNLTPHLSNHSQCSESGLAGGVCGPGLRLPRPAAGGHRLRRQGTFIDDAMAP